MPFPMTDTPDDEDQNYKQMLISQLNAPPPVPSNDGQNQLIASLTNSMNKLGTVGGKTADSSDVQRYADVLDKTKAMRDQTYQGQAAKRQDILYKLAALKDKTTQNQNALSQASDLRKQDRDFNTQRDQDKFERDKELLGLKNQGEKDLLMAKTDNATPKPSVAQQAVDRNFGKDYNDFIAQGGSSQVFKGIEQVRQVANDLKSDDSLTGGLAGRLPDSVRAFTNPQAVDVREKLEDVVQRGMRQIMGPQFTENEGKRLLARAYNPALPASTNAKRVDSLVRSMEQMAQSKLDAVKYYEDNGSLVGFKGNIPSSVDQAIAQLDRVTDNSPGMNDVYAAEPNKNQMAPNSGPKVGTIVKGYQFTGGDPADKKNWVKKQDTNDFRGE